MASNILIAVTGSISAYKIADVVSELSKRGHRVQCIVTESATQFVTPLVLETLSGRPVKSALFGPGVSGTEHIDLARWADIFVVAPASANILAKLALGLADDLLTTVALATTAPLLIAPAMNTVMWDHKATQQNLGTLVGRGASVIHPAAGTLACGEVGVGKLAPVPAIVEAIEAALVEPKRDLEGVKVLITAGPTTSPIDAVRYITNHSTGRMGAAMAEEALRRGAEVRYVLGVDKGVVRPEAPKGSADRLTLVEVRTAEEMAAAALRLLPGVNGVVATAAVLDYRVANAAAGKLKRAAEATVLDMIPSVDVLGSLRAAATDQWFVGFAAETDNVEANGRGKLESKGLDFLFANPVARVGETSDTGFSVPTNAGTLLRRDGDAVSLPVMSKAELARRLWDLII
ncbi:bifunctional phosphopantothenoylcysteine decarboxylase/phosphopantothenate--cysteine ligase CoaBC [Devosia sp. SL43]|uniref:bifunctional phosphopantothenoylcysteine decarboxylase/phosphopantothenate--cysteine ligase CoaBC n=1 Tax=Devosia sp. SL43 TaxID=2806348 RepID=UPI001F004997|nr:bifunctional phosphopantothenoylcysteine decarboxylase/phosphopantothenate--cysteine ligase CoaBC [Devosia sp. SL43]UJW84235.1 bifunctional phosphopantothenoylcysteine decarboxylase/phosphopantothenate--cysteine ligase CoaBC [Devosia sp. SL43]